MNPPERFPPDDPREWLNRARSSFASSRRKADDYVDSPREFIGLKSKAQQTHFLSHATL